MDYKDLRIDKWLKINFTLINQSYIEIMWCWEFFTILEFNIFTLLILALVV